MNPIILIIDDDAAMRHIFKTILLRRGFEVITAFGVADALEQLTQTMPDVICLDLMMADISGIEFLKIRRKSPKLLQIPVIIISAAGERKMIDQAMELGGFSHLSKPVSSSMLVEELERALKHDGS